MNIRYNVNLRTWFDVGGCVDVLYKTDNEDGLAQFLYYLPRDIKVRAIGAASNILISDSGFNGVVVKPRFYDIEYREDEGIIEVGASVLDSTLSQFAFSHSIEGFEFLSTIPGTIGGGVAMNAGCYGCTISDLLISVIGVTRFGEIVEYKKEDCGFSYRHNSLEDVIFTRAKFRANIGYKCEILEKIDLFKQKRTESQPSGKTCGSTFCNPETHRAWELLDKLGLRGYRIGGAHFSEKHCNFIINDRNAIASDIENLILLAEKSVKNSFDIELKREIIVLK